MAELRAVDGRVYAEACGGSVHDGEWQAFAGPGVAREWTQQGEGEAAVIEAALRAP
jgi:hypothetical protein